MLAYVYCAALLCEDCGDAVKAQVTPPEGTPNESLYDSSDYPKGPYPDGGGEGDTPNHCDNCGTFLENPVTGDGETYVRDSFAEFVDIGRGDINVLRKWRDHYDYCFDDFLDIGLDMMREEKDLTEVQEFRLAELRRD